MGAGQAAATAAPARHAAATGHESAECPTFRATDAATKHAPDDEWTTTTLRPEQELLQVQVRWTLGE